MEDDTKEIIQCLWEQEVNFYNILLGKEPKEKKKDKNETVMEFLLKYPDLYRKYIVNE